MSIASAATSPHRAGPVARPGAEPPARSAPPAPRVRQQARDAATLMAFSAAVSVGLAVCLLLLAIAARQA